MVRNGDDHGIDASFLVEQDAEVAIRRGARDAVAFRCGLERVCIDVAEGDDVHVFELRELRKVVTSAASDSDESDVELVIRTWTR